MEEGDEGLEEWPPREAQVRSALWRAESHIERAEYVHAVRALDEALPVASDPELLHGLRHLAAAGYKAHEGDALRARRQLAHARRRLAPYLPEREQVDIAALLARVEADVADVPEPSRDSP